ncbi:MULTISPECIES: WGxxGxxG family protein [Trichocoleus]|uniref:WGxxGxxG-CTERM domain-containing protein n=1 Tax=Trichocoleus desertorum GB2-A4 TaxID=2933944 RepID=A0ABV0J9K4_9CYAN|nr:MULTISPECIES: WGxxGxxG family protein [unclassified Trichocoleus]MBD1862793.1 WGxxGxxG-CTERM domain-containing protein [Trichocoleus sp. FACHB-46]MBD2095042.1 WGxxGxxG-CTERM domain-containing protein [Trichocoleus sp. FACHB-591]MBD2124296.1 WGxxGxxG-CTERM domain-containing protein [Trichocoleus sp. FACHB-262]
MKSAALSKFIGAGVLSLSLAALPLTLPAGAQTDAGTSTTSGTDTTSTYNNTDTATEGDRDFDWGWLGLLGLAGLAGLAKKSHEEPTRYREPEEVSRTGTRY